MHTLRALAFILFAVIFMAAETGAAPTPAPSATGVPPTAVPPGTVTSVVDPSLLTHARNVLHGIARDPKTGDLYVGVWNNLRHYNLLTGGFTYSNDDSLRRITPSGEVSRLTSFPYPQSIAINPHDGSLYVATGALGCGQDMFHNTTCRQGMPHVTHGIIVVKAQTGEHHDFAGRDPGFAEGVGPAARFTVATGIAFDPDNGNLYVADGLNVRIRQVTPDGTVSTLAGSGTPGDADGSGSAAAFRLLRGIAYCPADKSLYVADPDNNEIRKVSTAGDVSTFAGAPEAGYVDGARAAARFDHPAGVACDAAGNIYVADTDNNVIRQISPAGVVSTLAGAKEMGTVNAVGSNARFSNPIDLIYDPSDGSLYVIDWGANNVRKVTTAK